MVKVEHLCAGERNEGGLKIVQPSSLAVQFYTKGGKTNQMFLRGNVQPQF